MTMTQRFYLKTEILFGDGLYDRLEVFRGRRICIVTDGFMVRSGMVGRLQAKLPPCELAVFAEVVPEPPVDGIAKGARVLAEFRPDAVVAFGGGSVIDAAKAMLATLREMDGPDIVLVAVPTTSGTGSEVTCYAVISEPERGIKHPLRSPDMVPDLALLDPDLVASVPPAVTADTGMDVITHALEAYVSTGATDFSDAFAEKALALAFAKLPAAYADGGDRAARAALHNASCMAGVAFNAAGLGLNHGLAHAIGGRFHLPHGRINAMLLPLVVDYNAGTQDGFGTCLPAAERYAEIARRVGLEASTARGGSKALALAIARMNDRFGIPATLRAAGIDMDDYARAQDQLAEAAFADACTASNPRTPTAGEVAGLIRAVGG